VVFVEISDQDAPTTLSEEVFCDTGDEITGGGYENASFTTVTGSYPLVGPPDGWHVNLQGPSDDAWRVYAVCADTTQ
jgi:hypothetical protein